MTAHSLTHQEAQRSPAHRDGTLKRVQLGMGHFWLIVALLGGLLGLIATVLVVSLVRT